jgi:tetratricopeptide (TPR) repeat protein
MKRHVIAFLLIVLSVFLAYSNSLKGTWAMDDIIANEPLKIHHIRDFFGFRKITYITFHLNQLIAPFNPASFRFVNILIHILNVFLVYVLARVTLILYFKHSGHQKQGPGKGGKSSLHPADLAFYTALLAGAFFAVHPINISVVAYIVQRMAALSTLFVLLSLLSYITARQSPQRLKSVPLYLFSGLCVVMGIFSKENAVIAILLVLLYDYVFISGFNRKGFLQKLSVFAGIGILSLAFASYFLNLHIVLADLAGFFLEPNSPLSGKGWMAADVSWTSLQHFLTEFRVLSRYLFLLVLPLPQFLAFVWWSYPVSTGITEPITTLFSMVVVFSLLSFSLLRLKRFPLLCFGILWYLIAISLESFFALGSDLYFEHRNYLPLTGLVIGIFGQVIVSSRITLYDRRVWTAAVIVCVVFGSLSFMRNNIWRDSLTLWNETLKRNPSDYRVHNNLGYAYQKKGMLEKAIEHYETAVRLKPDYPKAHNNLGYAYQAKGFLGKAIEHYRAAVRLKPDYSIAQYNLGNVYNVTGIPAKAVEHYKVSIGLNPSNYRAHNNLGVAYHSLGIFIKAIEHYKRAIELRPDYHEAYTNLGNTSMALGQIDSAVEYYKFAIQLNPNYPEAHFNLARAYKSQNDNHRAEKHFDIARRLKPEMFTSKHNRQ